MASKIIAQVLIYTTNVVTRAFADAYRQAAANGGKRAAQNSQAGANAGANTSNAGANAGAQAGSKRKVPDAKLVFGGIDIAQARQVLNVSEKDSPEQIKKHFEHLFAVNEKKKGGSFYLQSKVVRAKEALDWLQEEQDKANGIVKKKSDDKKDDAISSSPEKKEQ
ncbi:hypothetical protein SARC_03089 [Sphaeroforma arctica JP610]|uniref:Mitochondrial import inner membrane translocase subunit TIM16 n=1 Tax=Sphaeroforma arctica JP610 TaxID=667725 RepID=A0A0L0G6R9_9EUKA|nr:hypothetical protein SARC_03089 [Sphaeroforma arctica JP610]KNC84715.1 hypothetical protein SARC_03089 [Sphaeroforma arctica JP610]|eukprot:XP_014158617.1 hypothetical protein SARC_03089 [Sphaeroforma arctica JP610]